MLLPVGQMIEGRGAPLCVESTARVREALRLMLKNDISQLPVVDGEGDLVGIISHKTISQTLFLLGDRVPLLELTVDHCIERVDTIEPDDDVFEACDRMAGATGALVVTEGRKPTGIVTTGDLMLFFRNRSEDFIKIEDIEVTLRLRTRDAFPDDAAMDAALLRSLGPDPANPARPRKSYDELSLGELIGVITHPENWPAFNGIFEPLELFSMLMERVRQVRNLLAHFRGHTDQMQERVLKYAMDWLAMRAGQAQVAGGPRRAVVNAADAPSRGAGNRWEPLKRWLAAQEKQAAGIRMSFADLQTLLGGPLPAAALKHSSWWSNTNLHEAQVGAWTDAGWQVGHTDIGRREVIFVPRPEGAEIDPKIVAPTS